MNTIIEASSDDKLRSKIKRDFGAKKLPRLYATIRQRIDDLEYSMQDCAYPGNTDELYWPMLYARETR